MSRRCASLLAPAQGEACCIGPARTSPGVAAAISYKAATIFCCRCRRGSALALLPARASLLLPIRSTADNCVVLNKQLDQSGHHLNGHQGRRRAWQEAKGDTCHMCTVQNPGFSTQPHTCRGLCFNFPLTDSQTTQIARRPGPASHTYLRERGPLTRILVRARHNQP